MNMTDDGVSLAYTVKQTAPFRQSRSCSALVLSTIIICHKTVHMGGIKEKDSETFGYHHNA